VVNKNRIYFSDYLIKIIKCFIGGLTAVIWTDFIQTIIMIISAVILMIISKVFFKDSNI
jgi:Na+/pantothenate symporter